ncbi:C40 family peptidase [Paenibacillus montanisoli]|uniref:Cell wall-associated hydrolase n=1 Tax=Paenibacillus montanisoli TaxID=2081970 RepID=A0A328UAL6_9BACL|nr:C40 family peptidase [Paenibacillus montanisoli]RAP78361.1 cell wall-associated hydrolase [Paenibacillus montanisoli]
MNNTTNKRVGKKLLGVVLSLSVAFAGSMLLAPKTTHAATDAETAARIISKGKQYLGTPYRFGARSGITSSFDCSSFVQYVYKKYGVKLPRGSRDQARMGRKVLKSNLKRGDLVFSDTNRDGKINHVSIYIGNGKLLHTYRVGIGVTISNFKGSVWDRTYVTARDVI